MVRYCSQLTLFSDYIATSVRSTSTYSDYAVGAWAANHEEGVRHYHYSTDVSVNPSTYETPDKPGFFGLHVVGEVWAEMLWVIQQRFIAKHGFSDTLFPPVPSADGTLPPNDFYRPQTVDPHTGLLNPLVPKHGNTLLLQLVINGMKMQPCDPSFFDARDAIIDADKVLTGGENFCDIWQGFAGRGLGVDATLRGRTPWGGGLRKNVSRRTDARRLGADVLCIRVSEFQLDAGLSPRSMRANIPTIMRLFGTRSRAVLGGFWGCLGVTDRAGIKFLGQKSRRQMPRVFLGSLSAFCPRSGHLCFNISCTRSMPLSCVLP